MTIQTFPQLFKAGLLILLTIIFLGVLIVSAAAGTHNVTWKPDDRIKAYVWCMADKADPTKPGTSYYELRQIRKDDDAKMYNKLMMGMPDRRCYDTRMLGLGPEIGFLISHFETYQAEPDKSKCLTTWRMRLPTWPAHNQFAYIMLDCPGAGA